MRTRLVVLLVLAFATAIAATPAQAAMKGCDLTGDSHRADDCITHSHVGASADGNLRPGQTITIREHIADALRGENLVTEVQVRRVDRVGRKGPWLGLSRTRWSAADTTESPNRTIDVCRGKLSGRYEFRTAARLLSRAGRQASQPAITIATSVPVLQYVPTATFPGACPQTEVDMANVEYFNQMAFSGSISVVVADQGSSFAVSLSCVPPASAPAPSPTFGVALGFGPEESAIVCNVGQYILDKATLQANAYEGCVLVNSTPACAFEIVGYNTSKLLFYSYTLLDISLVSGGSTLVPVLNPATLIICPTSSPPCVLAGTCVLSTSTVGKLSQCAAGERCTDPPRTGTYGYNENMYFRAPLKPTPQ